MCSERACLGWGEECVGKIVSKRVLKRLQRGRRKQMVGRLKNWGDQFSVPLTWDPVKTLPFRRPHSGF